MISQEGRWAAAAVFVLLGWTVLGWTMSGRVLSTSIRGPNAGMSPHDVVVSVLDALQHNDSPLPNTGLRSVYRFASPDNRRVTGPYGRFLRLVRTSPNNLLLKPSAVDYGARQETGNDATEDITIRPANAGAIKFRFVLSRQTEGPCPGCWMVDGVVPVL